MQVITASLEKKLCLVLPLIEERTLFSGVPVRLLRSPTNPHSCRFDAVRRLGGDGEGAVAATWKSLRTHSGWDILDFREVPEDGTITALVNYAERDGFRTAKIGMRGTPYVAVPLDSESLDRLPRNARLRGKLRHVRTELAMRGGMRLRSVTKALPDDFRKFLALEAGGWKGDAGSAISIDEKARRFYTELVEVAGENGYLLMYYLEANGSLLAAHLGLSYRGTYYSPKLAYAEGFSQFAPGHLIISEILKDCLLRGVRTYDITGPDDEWKMRWTNSLRPRSRYLIFQRGFVPSLAHALRFRVRPLLKRIIGAHRPTQ
jgi:hypothetical protein